MNPTLSIEGTETLDRSPFAPASRARILLADDDHSVLASIGRALESEGFEVIPASTGREAIERFFSSRIDLAILDLSMPDHSGWDTLERIQAYDLLLPIIVITARTGQFKLAAAAGVTFLLEKPVEMTVLVTVVERILHDSLEKRLHQIAGHHTVHVRSSH